MTFKHFSSVLLLTLLVLAAAPAAWATPPLDRNAVLSLFKDVNRSIDQGDQQAVLALYGNKDQAFIQRAEVNIANLLKLEALEYDRRVTEVEISGDAATAIAFERMTHTRDERRHTEVAWQTIRLAREDGPDKPTWRIVSEEDRDYLMPVFTDLALDLRPEDGHLTATARLDLSVTEAGEDNILLSLNRGLEIESILTVDGQTLDFERSDRAVIIDWDSRLLGNEKVSVTVAFSGQFFNEFEEQGYSLVNIGPDGCFANFVTDWYPRVNGRLTKTRGRMVSTVPEDLIVASVGRLVSTTTEGGRSTFIYDIDTAMDFTFNANRFFHQSRIIDGVRVNVYLLSGGQEKADLYSSKAMEIVSYSKEIYGIFPFDSYSISEVPPEITGGLGGSGGQGLNFYPVGALNDTAINFPLIAHESGHMWWGSWVLSEHGTMIDEGFSQLNAVLNIRHFFGEQAMREFVKNGTNDYPQSARLYFKFFGNGLNDVPIGVHDEDKVGELNRLAYTKAFVVYTMLMEKVGHETFLRGIRRIVDEYANRYFDLAAFRSIMEEESKQDLGQFFEQWFHRTGAPEYALDYSIDQTESGYAIVGTVTQVRDLYSIDAELAIVTNGERSIRTLQIADKITSFEFPVATKPTEILFDPDYKILRWTDEFKALSVLGEAARLTHEGGEPEQAVELLSAFLEDLPDHREGRFRLAMSLMAVDRRQEARSHLERVVAGSDPLSFSMADWPVPLSHVQLGGLLEELGEETEAREHYARALEYPNVDDSHQVARSALQSK